ncbi:MAG: Ig-like domain-containing protein [Clostridiales bacterium]|nr:Ig-like domain-containing protein [Clostridiales bacterium]
MIKKFIAVLPVLCAILFCGSATCMPEFVDMGTGVLWATENLGVDDAHPLGSYYRPGATGPVDSANGASKLADAPAITVRNWNGDSSLDAVTALYGEGYSTPTEQQFRDLLNACTRRYETVEINGETHGVFILKSTATGNELRFTGIGYMLDGVVQTPDAVLYLTSTGDVGTSYNCYYMNYNAKTSWPSILARKQTGLQYAYPLRAVSLPGVKVTGVQLNESILTIAVGKQEKLNATVLPADAKVKTLAWSSSDTNVATVDADGTVTAVAVGECEVTATTTDGTDLSATCRIFVNNADDYTLRLIDMGTEVLWADNNLGVDADHPRGRHYLFGGLSPYPENSSSWFYSNPLVDEWGGDPNCDAAAAELGQGWSTPSRTQFEELFNACDVKISYSYTYGRMLVELTSRITGNKLSFIGTGLYSYGNDHTADYADVAFLTSSGVAGSEYDCYYVTFTKSSSDDPLKAIKLRKDYALKYAYAIRPVAVKNLSAVTSPIVDAVDADTRYIVYDISGRKLLLGVTREEVAARLDSGVYILKGSDGKSIKIKL